MNGKRIGDRLRILRGDRTPEEIAQALGITTRAYNQYEAGDRIPRDPLKKRIAEYFRTSPIAIFFAD